MKKLYLPLGLALGIALSLAGVAYAGTLIQNNQLANDNVTVNGTSIVLGGSGTVTANTTNSLSVSGSITGTSFNGSAAVSNWALNMAHANTWTAAQGFPTVTLTNGLGNSTIDTSLSNGLTLTSGGSFIEMNSPVLLAGGNLDANSFNIVNVNKITTTYASTTQLSAASQKFYVNSAGETTCYDTIHSWSGQCNPTRAWSVGLATSTTWIATTTSPYNLNAITILPFTGTLKQAVCYTNTGTLTAQLTIGGTSKYIAAVSATPATTTLNMTFGEGAKFSMNAGNPASSPKSITCTLYATETP